MNTYSIQWIFATCFLAAACAATLLTPRLIFLSGRLGWMDIPEGRKIHEKPTPLLGGLVLFSSFWLTVIVVFLLGILLRTSGYLAESVTSTIDGTIILWPKLSALFAGSAVIWIIGALDDRFNLSPIVKLFGQAAACVILMTGTDLRINLTASLGYFGDVITFFWLLLIINAFNFIDSIDGHCAGVALASCAVFFCLFQIIQQPLVAILVVTFAGTLLGFLPYNFKKAKIFLGDNGSLFIGYTMGAVTLLASYNASTQGGRLTLFIPILMFGVPIYDTISVVVVRLLRGIPPWRGDRNHFAHRLIRLGMGEKIAVIFSIFVTIALGLISILSTQVSTRMGDILILLLFFCFVGLIAFLEYYSTVRIRLAEDLAKQNRRRRDDIRTEEERLF